VGKEPYDGRLSRTVRENEEKFEKIAL